IREPDPASDEREQDDSAGLRPERLEVNGEDQPDQRHADEVLGRRQEVDRVLEEVDEEHVAYRAPLTPALSRRERGYKDFIAAPKCRRPCGRARSGPPSGTPR